MRWAWSLILIIFLSATVASAQQPQTATIVASKEKGWPQWRGPRRDGICDEKGLLKSWPDGGPKTLWTTTNMGFGYSAPIITADTIYITGDVDDQLFIFALDMDGKVKWKSANGQSWKGSYPGARASCTYDAGRLYHMNAHGRVACLDAQTGRELWAVNVLERFEGKNLPWALSENLLIDADRVIVTPGGNKALMAALDRNTGQTLWSSEALRFGPDNKADAASYSSPVLFTLGGMRQIVSASSQHVFGVDADTGRLLWKSPIPTRYQVLAMTPVVCPDGVFMTGPDSKGGTLYRLKAEGGRVQVEEAWTASIDTCHGGVVLFDGFLYGTWYRQNSGWGCVDARTGQIPYRTRELAMGSILYADGRLYCLGQDGVMALVEANPTAFRIISRFSLTDEKVSDAWAHPIIHQGRLYLRYHGTLQCRQISGPISAP